MTIQIPSKQDMFYVLEMLEASLIDYSYTQPWADQIVVHTDKPPSWVCDIAVATYQGDVIKAVREYIYSEPFENAPKEIGKFHVACLWLRYERRELSWAKFLQMAGQCLDCADGEWDCETPYHYLNVHEDAYFTEESEQITKQQYLADHDLTPWIDAARKRYSPFFELRRTDKHQRSGG